MRHHVGIFSLFAGVFLVIVGAALVIFPGVASASPPAQHESFSDTACLSCHQDQARLREIIEANEEDVPEESEASLSSGPG